MRIVSYSGKAGQGKDTCARLTQEILRDEHGKNLAIWSFGHPLKATVYSESRGWYSIEEVWDIKPPEVRTKLQRRGTEEGRLKYGEDVWTLQNEAFLRIFETWGFVDAVAIPDARFPNEVEFIKLGGRVPSLLRQGIEEEVLEDLGLTAEEEDYLLRNDPPELYALEKKFNDLVNTRYEQEKLRGGVTVRIRSDRPTLTGEAALHPSETSLDHLPDSEFDFIIVNNRTHTFEDLKEQLRPVVKTLLSR